MFMSVLCFWREDIQALYQKATKPGFIEHFVTFDAQAAAFCGVDVADFMFFILDIGPKGYKFFFGFIGHFESFHLGFGVGYVVWMF